MRVKVYLNKIILMKIIFIDPGFLYYGLSSDIANQLLGPLPVTTGTATPRKIKLLIGGNNSLEGVRKFYIN